MASKVQASGPESAKIMIVGEAPGREEEREGVPFVGAAGNLLRRALLSAGIRDTEVFFTNVCKYRPKDNNINEFFEPKSGRPLMPILEGMMELGEEIAHVNPNVIIALGNTALWATAGKGHWKRGTGYVGIGDWRGSIIEGRESIAGGRKIVAAYHPAAVLRKYPFLQTFDLDLKRAKAQSFFPDIRRPRKTLHIDPQGEDRLRFRDWLLNTGSIITFDIEYIGSDLLCVGMTVDEDQAVVIRTRNGTDIQYVKDILCSGKPLCAQNGMFDCSVLEHWYHMPLIRNLKYDTMLASHAAYIEMPKDLGFLCSIYTEQPCYWTNIDWKKVKADLSIADSVDFLMYNAIDTWVTHAVMEAQSSDELLNPNVKKTFDFEMSLLEPLWEMSRKGMRVDAAKMKLIEMACNAAIKERGEELDLLAGWPVNVMSGPQMKKLLKDKLGLPILKLTEKGAASYDDNTLAAIDLSAKTDEQRRAVSAIRDIRKNRALISKFVEIEYDSDGRMRCHYSPAGTTTGRLSSKQFYPTRTGANLQNIPRDKRVRSVFIPDPGYAFFYNDLERAESLVVAELTQDPIMLKHHEPGADAHILLAMILFNKKGEDITPDERYMGKQTRHAGNYMQGWKTFQTNINKKASETGVSIGAKEAKYFVNTYRSIHVGLPIWWQSIARELQQDGRTLYNLLGRPRTFFDRLDAILPTAVAYKPQSTVGDVLNVALQRCYYDEELRDYGVELLVQVHDAIGGQVKHAWVEPAMKRMAKLMKVELISPKTLKPFTIPVEIAVGDDWGSVKRMAI